MPGFKAISPTPLTPAEGLSLLHMAVRSGKVEVVEALLAACAKAGHAWDACTPGLAALTPLHLAAVLPDAPTAAAVVDRLLAAGGVPAVVGWWVCPCLHGLLRLLAWLGAPDSCRSSGSGLVVASEHTGSYNALRYSDLCKEVARPPPSVIPKGLCAEASLPSCWQPLLLAGTQAQPSMAVHPAAWPLPLAMPQQYKQQRRP